MSIGHAKDSSQFELLICPYAGFSWISAQELAFGKVMTFFIYYVTLHKNLNRSYDTVSGIGLSLMAGLLVMVGRFFSPQGSYAY